MSSSSQSPLDSTQWVGPGTTSALPPAGYWAHLSHAFPSLQLDALRQQFDQGLREFRIRELPRPEADARRLIDRVVSDGWLQRERRIHCPNCKEVLTEKEAGDSLCPYCNEPYAEHGEPQIEIVFVHDIPLRRSVDWVVAVHGMNTSGAWQEAFSWKIGTTWGRSVPVAVYKYGIVIFGVILAWRRRSLQRELRGKIDALRTEAKKQGYAGKPDLVAHSFGTWLIGHLLLDELKRTPADRLCFGRIILTGCILRPDFDWKTIKSAGLVEDVLNHFGTADKVVPLAHFTISDSGPSGRRGFDGDQAVNIKAEGSGHSGLFSVRDQKNGKTALENSYETYWHPFLTRPRAELAALPDREDPSSAWKPYTWILRGTLFPWAALPLVLTVILATIAALGNLVWPSLTIFGWVAAATVFAIFVEFGLIMLTLLWRRIR